MQSDAKGNIDRLDLLVKVILHFYTHMEEQKEGYVHRTFIVDPGQQPMRIDLYLMTKLEKITRNKIQKGIKEGHVLVDDKQIKANYKVQGGEVITIVMDEPVRTHEGLIAQDIPLDIVFEDDYLLVVNKPAGMVVHPGVGNRDGTLVNALAHHLGQVDGPVLEGNDADRPGLVHRIDKDTSGLLVIAKDEHSLSHLAQQFFDRTTERNYLAVVWGNFDEPKGTIDKPIGRHPNQRKIMHAVEEDEMGKHAITHYEVLEDLYYVSLINCKLETGRTHQIRVHMKSIGHPIFNDATYGGTRIVKGTVFSKYRSFVEHNFSLIDGQALHAASLGFEHPVTHERMYFEKEPPAGFSEMLERWRNYTNDRKSKL